MLVRRRNNCTKNRLKTRLELNKRSSTLKNDELQRGKLEKKKTQKKRSNKTICKLNKRKNSWKNSSLLHWKSTLKHYSPILRLKRAAKNLQTSAAKLSSVVSSKQIMMIKKLIDHNSSSLNPNFISMSSSKQSKKSLEAKWKYTQNTIWEK